MKLENIETLRQAVETEAKDFAKYNELPVSLVTAAFFWKLPAVYAQGGEEIVDAVCQEETVQEFWLDASSGVRNSAVWSGQLLQETISAELQRMDSDEQTAAPADIEKSAARLVKSVPVDTRWLEDVTYTPQYLTKAVEVTRDMVRGSVADFLLTPDTTVADVNLDDISVYRAEQADIGAFFDGEADGRILLMKQPQSEFYYAVMRGPDLRNWLSYGSYSKSTTQRERSFKTETNVQLKTTTARIKLEEKWPQYADRLVVKASNFERLKEVWPVLASAVPGLFPNRDRPKIETVIVDKPHPMVPEEEVQF